MVKIPFLDLPSFNQEYVLDNTSYVLNFNWNSRGEFWTMDILDQLRNRLISGIQLVLNYGLTGQYVGKSLPPGEFFVFDQSGNQSDILQDDFINDRTNLVYLSESEL